LIRGFYLGIDESNHGQFPEIITGCVSSKVEDIEEKNEKIGKHRKKQSLETVIGKKPFSHVVAYQSDVDMIGGIYALKTVVYTELIKNTLDVKLVLIDGKHPDAIFNAMEALLYPNRLPEIKRKQDGDQYWPLVNRADQIAYALFRYYGRGGHPIQQSTYGKRLLQPNMEEYAEKMVKLGIDFSSS